MIIKIRIKINFKIIFIIKIRIKIYFKIIFIIKIRIKIENSTNKRKFTIDGKFPELKWDVLTRGAGSQFVMSVPHGALNFVVTEVRYYFIYFLSIFYFF